VDLAFLTIWNNMKALIFDKILQIKEVPVPIPKPGEVLIRVLFSSICNTDQEIIKGYMGFTGILGHEFVGEVATESSKLYGQRVVGEINCPCGHCYLCKTGRPTHCGNRTVLGIFNHDGVFAEYTVLPESNLHVVPGNLSSEIAVFTEPLAAAAEIFDQTLIRPSQNVFIFGAGKLGSLISLVFRMNGCDYTTYDLNPDKVDHARKMGINATLISSLKATDKAEVCIDCTGSANGINMALSHLYPRGRLVLKTTVAETAKVDLNQLVINENQIIGSRCGPFAPALKLLAEGLVNPRPLITSIYPFESLPEAFEKASRSDTIKVLINHQKKD
jgi:threonine dehydrogenase-like Zn-dependent dehydrogenase